MQDPRVPLKNPIVAAILAYLIPGAGHWYQGRRFKATIYSVCILTIFVWGMILGNWQPVYSQLIYRTHSDSAQLERAVVETKFSFGYGAQFLVGAPALPSLIQDMRFRWEKVEIDFTDTTFDSDFTGLISERGDRGGAAQEISGRISILPVESEGGQTISRTFTATTADGKSVEYTLGDDIELGRAVFGSPRRDIRCTVHGRDGMEIFPPASLTGTVSRSFVNWFQAPRDTHELDVLHGDLSRRFDIACVFTWIAGLLNLLAIWDAAAGPAYGYGDEKPEPEDEKK